MKLLTYRELKKKSTQYSPSDFLNELGFENSLNMATQMLTSEEWDESLQDYSARFLEEIRKKYPEKWNSSWQYDALLGLAYHIILKYDERYDAYNWTFDKSLRSAR